MGSSHRTQGENMMPTLWVKGGQMQDREGGAAKRGVWAEAAPRDPVVNILCEGGACTIGGEIRRTLTAHLQGTLPRARGSTRGAPTLWPEACDTQERLAGPTELQLGQLQGTATSVTRAPRRGKRRDGETSHGKESPGDGL